MRVFVLGLASASCSLGCAPAGPPTAVEVCSEREGYTCRRELVAGRLSREIFDAECTDEALRAMCAPAAFTGCAPTRTGFELCLDALADFDRLETLPDALPECQDPCLGYAT